MAKAAWAVLLLFLAATTHAVEVDPAGGVAEIEAPADPFCKRPIIPSTGICRSTTNISVPDSILIVDYGDLTATYQFSNSSGSTSGSLNMGSNATLLYGQECIFLWASVTIVAGRPKQLFISPEIDWWLGKLGLGNVQVMTGALTFQVTHNPAPIPDFYPPNFFQRLQQAQSISILECASCFASNSTPPPVPRLRGLPGLSSFQKAWNFAENTGAVTSIFVQGTGFPDFATTFPGLQCSPGFLQILNNPFLSSLNGLDKLNTTIRPGPRVNIAGNPLLNTSASVAALTGLAGCPLPSTTSPLSSNIFVQTTLCNCTCWNQYCGFVSAGTCAPCAPPPTPSPPPPPVVNCAVTPSAREPVCGTVGGFVQVTDNGDGTCSAFTSAAGVFNPIPNCASLAYPSQGICNSLRSDLKITIRRASGAPYVQPDINKWLTQMGLNNVSLSQGSLTVELDHSPYPIPPTLAPSFLPFIRQVGALLMYECANCASPNIVPTTPALAGLPGLSKLAYIRGPAASPTPFGSVIIRGTAFTDLSPVSGLTCPAGYFQITDNGKLQSFNGLQGVQRAPLPVNVTFIATGNPLADYNSVNQISKLADCPPPSTTSTQRSSVYVTTSQCVLTSWSKYCDYVNNPNHPCNPAAPPPLA